MSNAERKVFYAIKDLLPDDYTAFHSLPVYRQADSQGGLIDGEIDFLVAHPDKGVLVIEVKGGGLAHNAASGSWSTTDAQGASHTIKNPFEQAKNYKYFLIEDLRQCRLTSGFRYPIAHAVWFPDIDLSVRHLGFSTNLEKIVLDARSLPAAAESIARLFTDSLGTRMLPPPGNGGIDALVRYFAPSWEIPTTLSAQIVGEDRQIIEATQSQYRVLSLLGRVPRALISGCAGSGKTVLAVEKARRLAAEGATVLVLCFNKRLGLWLKDQLLAAPKVDAFHFHGFCAHLCRESSTPIPVPDPHASAAVFFEHVLPDALIDALAENEQRYDAVIVDEGQDFLSSWWVPIQETLADPNHGTFYIFYDDNQTIYAANPVFPFSAPLLSLTENCRNTRQIHGEVTKHYRGVEVPACLGPDGRPPEIISGEPTLNALKNVVRRLVHEEGVAPEHITILSPLAPGRSQIPEGWRIGNLVLSWEVASHAQIISCSTIHAFKGLESQVVILVELAKVHPGTRNELLYVGMSRARHHLVMVE